MFLAAHGHAQPAGTFRGGSLAAQPDYERLPAGGERWISYRDFWFDFASSVIDPTDAAKVADVAAYLRQNPSYRLGIDGAVNEGHEGLGAQRAASVRAALVKAGVPAYKIHDGAFGDRLLRRERRVEVLFDVGR